MHFILLLLSFLLFKLASDLLNCVALVKSSFFLIVVACQCAHLILEVLKLSFRFFIHGKTRNTKFVVDNFGEWICEIAVSFLDFNKDFFSLSEFVARGARHKARHVWVQDPA